MMPKIWLWAVVMALSVPATADEAVLTAVVWHDIVERGGDDPYAVTLTQFREQLAYIRQNGYQPVSLNTVIRAWNGEEALPAKAVLLTFDDGLESYRRHALPELVQHGFPSVLSVVTAWADGRNIPAEYRGKVMDWDALRALARTPGVEIVSHSHDLHRGIPANPQGNKAPAAVTRQYDVRRRQYESEAAYRARILADLERSQQRLRTELGTALPAITWPYGAWDTTVEELARSAGLPVQLTVESWPTRAAGLPRIHRRVFHRYQALTQVSEMFEGVPSPAIRFVALELERLDAASHAKREEHLSAVIDRLALLRASGVVITPFSRDGRAAYFATPALPMRRDLLGRVLHQIAVRNRIRALYINIPDSVPVTMVKKVTADLARLNHVYGLMIAGDEDDTRWQQAWSGAQEQRPGMPIGRVRSLGAQAGAPVLQFVVDPAMPRARALEGARQARQMWPQALFMVGNTAQTPAAELAHALSALRQAGVQHYGYAYDAFERDAPAVLEIIDEFRGHTVSER